MREHRQSHTRSRWCRGSRTSGRTRSSDSGTPLPQTGSGLAQASRPALTQFRRVLVPGDSIDVDVIVGLPVTVSIQIRPCSHLPAGASREEDDRLVVAGGGLSGVATLDHDVVNPTVSSMSTISCAKKRGSKME